MNNLNEQLEATCRTCPAWVACGTKSQAGEEEGDCRARAPQTFLLAIKPKKEQAPVLQVSGAATLEVEPVFMTTHPTTPAGYWCMLHPDRKTEFQSGLELQLLEGRAEQLAAQRDFFAEFGAQARELFKRFTAPPPELPPGALEESRKWVPPVDHVPGEGFKRAPTFEQAQQFSTEHVASLEDTGTIVPNKDAVLAEAARLRAEPPRDS